MDRLSASGAEGTGSIPVGGTTKYALRATSWQATKCVLISSAPVRQVTKYNNRMIFSAYFVPCRCTKCILRGYTGKPMFIVYVLRSEQNGQLYVGYTTDLKQRLATHNKGSVTSTKSKRPWKLIFAEAYVSQEDALRRERYLKTTQGKNALRHMLRETLKIPIALAPSTKV